jgi:septum formation topological specificity factor MinE
MVKKKKLWRKTLVDMESTKVAAEALRALSLPKELYTHDVLGETLASDPVYPEKFAKEKYPSSLSRSDYFKIKNLPIKRPRADQSEVFDMWQEENEGSYHKPSHIPAVISPHPGQSYRPEKNYHQEILEKIVEEEQIKEIDEKKHNEVVNSFRVIDNDPSPVQSEDEIPVEFAKNPRVVEKYLTNTQRNIKMRNKLKEKLKKMLAVERKTQKQLDKIPQITKELERLQKKYKQIREAKKDYQKIKIELEKTGEMVPKIRMGKFRYKKPETQAIIEPSDNLRKLRVKGNNIDERMDSFIRRKMVDLYKPKDKKTVVIKDCTGWDNAKELHEARLKQKLDRESGNLTLKS